MLALRRRSRQVVVTHEECHGADMVGELLGKGQRLAGQACNAVPQWIVAPFEVLGVAGSRADRLVLRRRQPLGLPHILRRVTRGVRTGGVRHLGPQVLGTLVAASAHVQGKARAGLGSHREPHPRLLGLLRPDAGQCLGFHCQALAQDIVLPGDRLAMQMRRQRGNARDEKAQEPLAGDPYGTTATA